MAGDALGQLRIREVRPLKLALRLVRRASMGTSVHAAGIALPEKSVRRASDRCWCSGEQNAAKWHDWGAGDVHSPPSPWGGDLPPLMPDDSTPARDTCVGSGGHDETWKVKVAQAMWAKFGKRPVNEFLDGRGEPQWASAEIMRISREMCMADLRKERLPKHNPYVGNFHRGISVSNASHPTWDLQVPCGEHAIVVDDVLACGKPGENLVPCDTNGPFRCIMLERDVFNAEVSSSGGAHVRAQPVRGARRARGAFSLLQEGVGDSEAARREVLQTR